MSSWSLSVFVLDGLSLLPNTLFPVGCMAHERENTMPQSLLSLSSNADLKEEELGER